MKYADGTHPRSPTCDGPIDSERPECLAHPRFCAWKSKTIQIAHRRSVVISFVELNLLGYKRPVGQCNVDRDDPVRRNDREGHDRRVRFKSRTGQMKIGDALLELDACRTSFATAIVVCLVCDVNRREHLESEQQGNAHGGKKPSCSLAYAPELSESKHLHKRPFLSCSLSPTSTANSISYFLAAFSGLGDDQSKQSELMAISFTRRGLSLMVTFAEKPSSVCFSELKRIFHYVGEGNIVRLT